MLNYLYKGLPYDCYFCRSDIFGFSNDIKGAIKGDIKDMLGGVNDVLTTNFTGIFIFSLSLLRIPFYTSSSHDYK